MLGVTVALVNGEVKFFNNIPFEKVVVSTRFLHISEGDFAVCFPMENLLYWRTTEVSEK